ncbi:hypothetical protein BLA24_06665 [Streptomyces cinnamoneus]|uniref:Uncharacterized protein n=1 Tax=Streptomyces cinnamoneus TaxID=53446 RepID=A0A2G1XMQ9_STRCJ|nr:DUF6182 family protein [Streptomyces cinnamoneus]PHQ52461.1 hypothetical protein BLA24_06665 [Streptomyces cinnamoneus]PPT15993.1 hypothetical protein CYQ11_26815 [Streptomyces cinnamoneus]
MCATGSGGGVAAIAVLHEVVPEEFASSVLEFTAALSEEERRCWLGEHTRTRYLVGNPANLAGRLPPTTAHRDGRVAWYREDPRTGHRELRLLLRALRGELPADPPPYVLHVPRGLPEPDRARSPRSWRITVDVRDLTLPGYLVHLGHTLSEPAITGVLRAGDRIAVHHTRRLTPPAGGHAYLRVHRDTDDPRRLRAYAVLADESAHD